MELRLWKEHNGVKANVRITFEDCALCVWSERVNGKRACDSSQHCAQAVPVFSKGETGDGISWCPGWSLPCLLNYDQFATQWSLNTSQSLNWTMGIWCNFGRKTDKTFSYKVPSPGIFNGNFIYMQFFLDVLTLKPSLPEGWDPLCKAPVLSHGCFIMIWAGIEFLGRQEERLNIWLLKTSIYFLSDLTRLITWFLYFS